MTHVEYVRSGLPDFTFRQLAVLEMLSVADQPLTVRGMASELNVQKPVISRAITTLSRQGFARRDPDPGDRRNVLITITKPGRKLIESLVTQLN